MTFTTVCRKGDIAEGGTSLLHVGKKSVLLVWPQGGELKAYRGRCPHADMPLAADCFDGRRVVCDIHHWGFDAGSGKCVTHAHPSALHPYPVQIDGDEVQVDVGVVRRPGIERH